MAATISVLVVDEDRDVLELTKTFLEREDERLDVATQRDPTAVLDRLESEDVDAIVSDYRMPGLDGLELFEAVRENYPDVPFVLLTADTGDDTTLAASEAGVTAIIRKGAGTDHYVQLAEEITDAVDS